MTIDEILEQANAVPDCDKNDSNPALIALKFKLLRWFHWKKGDKVLVLREAGPQRKAWEGVISGILITVSRYNNDVFGVHLTISRPTRNGRGTEEIRLEQMSVRQAIVWIEKL